MMKFKQAALSISILAISSFSTFVGADTGLTLLSDSEMAAETGQALFNMSYIAPTDAKNKMGGAADIGFYKLGIEADLELNANIRKLQLGCGGVNGAGGCDIDIDNFSLSGVSETSEGRVASDAVLKNPFIEFAIKNPNSASTRELKGVRLSAEQAFGMLSFGTENSDTPNGINSLSGYLKLASATGNAKTIQRDMTNALGNMTGRISIRNTVVLSSDPRPFSSDDYSLTLAPADVPFTTQAKPISGNRMKSVSLSAFSEIPTINFSGPLRATIDTALIKNIKLQKNVTGSIANLGVNIAIDQNLGLIHKIPISGNPFSLSLQQQQVFWPGATIASERGWWLALEDQVNIGNVSPSNGVTITDALLLQVLPKVNTYLYDNPIVCEGIGGCLGGNLPITNPIDLKNTIVNLPLSNLKLSAQDFAPNCYGGRTFC